MIVTTGISALRKPCTITTRQAPAPLAQAVRTKSMRSVSIIAART